MDPFTYFIIFVTTLIIGYALAPKPGSVNQQPTAFEDFDFPQVDEGTPQAVVFGDCWSGDWTVLAVGNYRTSPIKVSGGGKK